MKLQLVLLYFLYARSKIMNLRKHAWYQQIANLDSKSNLFVFFPLKIIEQIIITNNWNDQLHSILTGYLKYFFHVQNAYYSKKQQNHAVFYIKIAWYNSNLNHVQNHTLQCVSWYIFTCLLLFMEKKIFSIFQYFITGLISARAFIHWRKLHLHVTTLK